jgi:hypothetical protein
MNLHSLVSQVLDLCELPDPTDVSDEVLRRIGPGQERAALEQALPTFVRSVNSGRRSSLGSLPAPSPIPGQGVAFHQRGVTVSDAWRRALRDREKDPQVGYMFLGDATSENLQRMAERRDQMASANRVKSQRLRALANALDEYGVKQVKDLPAEVLAPLLGGKA